MFIHVASESAAAFVSAMGSNLDTLGILSITRFRSREGGDGDLDICSKTWSPRKDNSNGGRMHVDFLENLLIQKPEKK